ncbi:hypothetical protein [Brevibacillus daliensis]|uniref:hypothetical protein n=1 Tax=Brevibacillus daliensis TaxID=2892995 RepID=UPI001E456BE0|nr:hypothetical protein [Brevibacillus daliensis]
MNRDRSEQQHVVIPVQYHPFQYYPASDQPPLEYFLNYFYASFCFVFRKGIKIMKNGLDYHHLQMD